MTGKRAKGTMKKVRITDDKLVVFEFLNQRVIWQSYSRIPAVITLSNSFFNIFQSRQLGSPLKVYTHQQQQQQRGCSTNEFNNYFKLLTQMEQQHQMRLNNLRKQINQMKADKNEVKVNTIVNICLIVDFSLQIIFRRRCRSTAVLPYFQIHA